MSANKRCQLPYSTALLRGAVLACGVVASNGVLAADAGAELRLFQDETQQRMRIRKPAPVPIPQLPPSPSEAAAAAGTAQAYVSGFEVHGVTQFSSAEVANVLKNYAGRTLNTADIHAAAKTLQIHYRNAGYMLAKVFIPPQIFGQVIRLDVEEGHLEKNGIEVQNKTSRVETEAVQSILETHLYSDRPLRGPDLERALLLADDLPGVQVGSVIYPGQEVGTARLRTVMSDEPPLSGNVDFDNFNSKQFGQERLGATLYLSSPAGIGDQVVTRLVTSGSRSNYAYLTYLRPVSSYGTRVGASIDYFTYDANALYQLGNVNGYASDARLYLTHPLIRSRFANVILRTDLSHYRINDRNDFDINAERRLNLVTIALYGDQTHDALPNGITLFDASVTAGNLAVTGNSSYRAIDSVTAQTDGGFARFNFNVQRLQQVQGPWSVYGKLTGQYASRNLDSSQRYYLGGATSIAGYPIGEAAGDQGAEIRAELRRDLAAPWGGSLQVGLFYSQGWLKQHKNPWDGWDIGRPNASNDVTLKSVGMALTQTVQNTWVIRGLVGWQLGSNPVVNPFTGDASDGRKDGYRAWLQVIRYFGVGGG